MWQGALVSALLAGVLWTLRNPAPPVRYAVSLAALAGLLVRRSRRTCQAPNPWREQLERLATRMGLKGSVALRQSDRIESPMVLGWWRPVVLVPAGLLSGFPPRQVEALLLHELAHVRRHDVLVGYLQAVAETLLFFHPATWWVSGRVRAAREACCDDLAVQGGPLDRQPRPPAP